MAVDSLAAGGSASRRLMPVLFIGVFMSALDTAVIGPAIPALRVAFSVDNREVGLVMSVYVLFSLCSTALMANLSDRYGRRPIYLASVACFALGSLLIALSPRFWMLIASRAIQGIGAGGITPTASAVVGDSFPARRARQSARAHRRNLRHGFRAGTAARGPAARDLELALDLPDQPADRRRVLILGARVLPRCAAPRNSGPWTGSESS